METSACAPSFVIAELLYVYLSSCTFVSSWGERGGWIRPDRLVKGTGTASSSKLLLVSRSWKMASSDNGVPCGRIDRGDGDCRCEMKYCRDTGVLQLPLSCADPRDFCPESLFC